MIKLLLALAGMALSAPAWAAVSSRTMHAEDQTADQIGDDASQSLAQSQAMRVAEWIAATGDNDDLPYAIVDKNTASLLLFDGKAKPVGEVPVLVGRAVGDDATPGIGNKDLADVGPAEMTTPAGRFLAKYGIAAGARDILWVDYGTSVALHPIPKTVSKKERRPQRMLSPTAADHRITFGCINVPLAFYTKSIRPRFRKKGGYVYVLPDTKPLEEVFPRLLEQPVEAAGGSH